MDGSINRGKEGEAYKVRICTSTQTEREREGLLVSAGVKKEESKGSKESKENKKKERKTEKREEKSSAQQITD